MFRQLLLSIILVIMEYTDTQPEYTDKQFIEAIYELAFGHDAINRNFGHAEVIEQLEEFNEDSLKWDSIPDEEKEEWENAFYSSPDKEDLAE